MGAHAVSAAACTGALYHIELYLVCADCPMLDKLSRKSVCRGATRLKAGVYHFDAQALALRGLRQGDYRQILVEATAHEVERGARLR